jgi:hypothetical protein
MSVGAKKKRKNRSRKKEQRYVASVATIPKIVSLARLS